MIRDVFVVRPNAGQAVVELTGEHDLDTSEAIHDLFTSLVEQNDVVVVDISEALFIDSSFLHNLAQADRLAKDRGSRLRVQLGTTQIVHRVLEISGLLHYLDCVADREEALGAT